MRKFNLAAVPLALCTTLTLLPGCTDDNYDLSDIDTTVEVKVTDLVLPVNIDPIKLDNIIDINENDRIRVVDGHYAVLETGTFDTDDITIERIHLGAPEIETAQAILPVPGNVQITSFPIATPESDYSYHTSEVSDFIVSLDKVGAHFTLDIAMSFTELASVANSGDITDLTIQIPKGLTLYKEQEAEYNPVTGIYRLAKARMQGNKLDIRIEAEAINVAQAGIKFDYKSHTLDLAGKVGIVSGTVTLKDSDLKPSASVPSSVTLRSEYTMSDILVTSFSGEMDYKVDNSEFTNIDLSNLPDFLAQEGTNIRIVNPQLYLNIYNPLSEYSLYAETGMEITSEGRNGGSSTYTLDNGSFRIGGTTATPALNYCLSPTCPENYYEGYGDASYVAFSGLSNVLSGDGLPTSLKVGLVNPIIPRQRVNDLKLGVKLGAVHGNYTFYAPLNLEAGSTIVYSKREDGWSDENLEHLTINTLEVSMNITTDIPVQFTLTGYPVDKEGNRINNVSIEGGNVSANAQNEPVKLYITGEIKNLDGIEFMAVATAADSQTALNPNMNITLTNLRAKVSGNYTKEL